MEPVRDPLREPHTADWAGGDGGRVEHDEVAVFNATAVAAGPVGRVRLPQRIPDGFHGDWIPAAS